MHPLEREVRWLRRVRDHSRLLASERDPQRLLPQILASALEITDAERGFLVRVEPGAAGGRVHVEHARGWTRRQLEGAAGEVSRTVVERVVAAGRGLVTSREQDADVLDASSVRARSVVSIICVPLRMRGELRGVLYLDHGARPDVFQEADLEVLGTFADQAGLAMEAAEGRTRRPPTGESPLRLGRLVGGSAAMRALYAELERAAAGDGPVLVQGESGAGKALVARELHARGDRAAEPFVLQGCAGASEAQLEAELCGQAGGARGALERAGAGTLVLGDVADLPSSVQGRLVAALREGEVAPVGGAARRAVRCRLVATTRHDLLARAEAGAFRQDLLYRLEVRALRVPPLRERPEDLPALIAELAARLGAAPPRLTENAERLLATYAWPGNVRELENEVRRWVEDPDREGVSARQLSPVIREGRGVASAPGQPGRTLGEVEREMLAAALRESGGNKARAARRLGIPRSTLYGLIERYGLGASAGE